MQEEKGYVTVHKHGVTVCDQRTHLPSAVSRIPFLGDNQDPTETPFLYCEDLGGRQVPTKQI